MKKALVCGVNGQDGSWLSEFLLEKDYEVWGIARRTSTDNLQRVKYLLDNPNFHIIYGDVTDIVSIINAIETAQPDEFYNLSAQSFVGESWNQPILTANSTAIGCLNCLEALRISKRDTKYYFAGSSEQFGKVAETPQRETTPFYPRSPYGVSKVFGFEMTRNYRESYGMFCCSGILSNHESERRGVEFVTRKISQGVARIKNGLADHIMLGNLDAKRDWGYAPEFVYGMYLMLQQEKPDDYVLATGETHSIREFLDIAFKRIGITDWSKYVKQDPRFMRPAEVDILCGDASKAQEYLGWAPKVSFDELVHIMVDNDLKEVSE